MKRRSKGGSRRLVSAWCTTRSRNGAAEITRGFGSVDRERPIRSRLPRSREQVAPQREHLALEVEQERGHVGSPALPPRGGARGGEEMRRRREDRPEVGHAAHGVRAVERSQPPTIRPTSSSCSVAKA